MLKTLRAPPAPSDFAGRAAEPQPACDCGDDLSRNVYGLLGIPMDALDFPSLLRSMALATNAGAPFLISTPNVNFLVKSQINGAFRESMLLSDLCLADKDEEYAQDLSQAVLVSHLDMIVAVLNFLGIPHEDGFFAKDLDAKAHLTDGWQERVHEKFKDVYPDSLLRFYTAHLAWELLHT